ncbi:actin-related protein 2/3 complex subunit 3 [Mycena filopes]|nr:actin-related protein 2/3 complex subunit 3 [Mycena filopes]
MSVWQGNMAILPIKTKIRGPAPIAQAEIPDIIDETLDLFRANSLFRNFEIKGPADRTLIVLILYVSDCLAKIGTARTVPTQIEASKSLNTLSVRQELAARLVERLYADGTGKPSKWWMSFQKRRFMNRSLG